VWSSYTRLLVLCILALTGGSICALILLRSDGTSFGDTRGDTKGQLTLNRRATKGPTSEAEPRTTLQHKSR